MKTKPFRNQCPVCRQWVTNPLNYINSFRLQPNGEYRIIELCRACRDGGKA